MTATEAKWAERVREWRASGKTADEFASAVEYQASTLRFWASRLKTSEAGSASTPAIVRVTRAARRGVLVDRGTAAVDSSMEVMVGGALIVVRHGFDASLLRQVVMALGSAR